MCEAGYACGLGFNRHGLAWLRYRSSIFPRTSSRLGVFNCAKTVSRASAVFAPLVLLAISGLGSWTEFRDHGLIVGLFSILPSAILSGLLLGLIVLGDRVLLPRRAKRFVSQQKSIQGEISIGWDVPRASPLPPRTPRAAQPGATISSGWKTTWCWCSSRARTLLNVLPKRVLTDEQVVEIRSRLIVAVGPAGRLGRAKARHPRSSPSQPPGRGAAAELTAGAVRPGRGRSGAGSGWRPWPSGATSKWAWASTTFQEVGRALGEDLGGGLAGQLGEQPRVLARDRDHHPGLIPVWYWPT